MGVMRAALKNDRAAKTAGALEAGESLMVAVPMGLPAPCQGLGILELRPEKGRNDVARQIGGADIDPSILIDLAAEEFASVGAFFADDLGPLDEARVVDDQRAAFAGDEVLGLVEAEGRELSEASQ